MLKAKSPLLRCPDHYLNWGLLVMRAAMGVIFILHGYGKLFGMAPGMEAFTGMLSNIGVPAAGFFAYVVGLVELLGGIALLLGIFTRFFAPLIAVIMLVAFFTIKKALPAGDVDVALFVIAFALSLTGPGILSLSGIWAHKKKGSEEPAAQPQAV